MSFFLLLTLFGSLFSRKDFKCSMQVIPSYRAQAYSVTFKGGSGILERAACLCVGLGCLAPHIPQWTL